jgi:glycosyltransferase involved in cell wall biosynthesis
MTKRNRLLMIGNYLPAGKWNKNIWHYLAEWLAQRGWQVRTTSSLENKVLRLVDMLRTVWKERRAYDLAQIDVFSGQAFIYAEACIWLLTRLKKPVVLTLHGGMLPDFYQRRSGRVQFVLKRAAAVVTPSPYIQSALKGICPDMRLIPNPIELSSAIFRLRDKVEPKLIWVRAFHRVYNPSLVPEVIELLDAVYPEISIMMLGPDKHDGSLGAMKARARELSVERKIKVIGSVPHTDIPAWLDKADIFINTTNYDNAPRSVIEAMANGMCVVSTNVGGIPFIIDDGESGLLVPPSDALAMADAIQRILSDPLLAKKLSRHAFEKAQNNDWSTILPMWEELFYEVIS